eukprot:m.119415 g.119415  ORF g.119415 m.119415 type:complete len:371 (-) comp13676_c1_seq7:1193-2305(-)
MSGEAMSMYIEGTVRMTPDTPGRRYLPEGLQQVTLFGTQRVAGVYIQLGKEATYGELWFLDPSTNEQIIVSTQGHGRPGWFRSTNQPDTFLVGMEDHLDLVTITDRAGKAQFKRYVQFDVPGAPRVMINDGTVAPTNDIFCGFKDFQFDVKAKLALTMRVDGKDKSVIQTVMDKEVCANGNAFVQTLDGTPLWLHVDTAPKILYAIEYTESGLALGAGSKRTPLINFGDRVLFDQFDPNLFHDTMMPDGMCQWVAAGRQKVVVALFDFRSDQLRDGKCIQFDVTDTRNITIDCVYTAPNSPRVTHPALILNANGEYELWMTTAEEGVLAVANAANGLSQGLFGSVFVAKPMLGASADKITIPASIYQLSS